VSEETQSDLGVREIGCSPESVALVRETRESIVEASLDLGARRDCTINTGLHFFDHMLEQIAWNACLNVEVRFTQKRYRLTHVITEDVGLTLGRVAGRLVQERQPAGIDAAGSSTMAIDEAIAVALISFEGRANCYFDLRTEGAAAERVEDMLSADLRAYFDGFAQGARATLHLRSLQAIDPHHAWESVFRAFGVALRNALRPNPWRAGLTAGLKGTLE
jgi:imidazoleglycerol-phosphate dehydratase